MKECNDRERANVIFQQAEDQGFLPDTLTYDLVISFNSEDPQALLNFFQKAKQQGVRLSNNSYTLLLKACARQQDLEQAESVFTRVQESGKATLPMYTMILGMYIKHRRMEKMKTLFEEMLNKGLKLDERSFSVVLTGCLQMGDIVYAEEVLKKMKEKKITPSIKTYTTFLASFISKKTISEIENLWNEIKVAHKPDPFLYSVLLECHHKRGDWERFFELFSEMKDAGLAPTTFIYNLTIDALKKAKTPDEAIQLWKEAELRNPDKATFTSAISLYEAIGDANEAEKLRKEMRAKFGSQPRGQKFSEKVKKIEQNIWNVTEVDRSSTISEYNKLILVAKDERDFEKAKKVYEKMIENGVTPNIQTIALMCIIFSALKDYPKVISVFKLTSEIGEAFTSDLVYSLVIMAYNHVHEWQQAEKVFDRFKSSGIPATIGVYNSMLTTYNKHNQLSSVITLFREMVDARIVPDIITYNTVLEVLAKRREVQLAEQVWAQIRSQDLAPNSETYSNMIEIYEKTGRPEECWMLWKEMNENHVAPNISTQMNMIRAFSKLDMPSEMLDLVENLESRKIRLSSPAYNSLLSFFARKQDVEKVREFWNRMQEGGMSPNTLKYNILMDLYNKLREWEQAKGLWRRMKEDGVVPNEATYNIILEVFAKLEEIEKVREILSEIDSKCVGITENLFCTLTCIFARRRDVETTIDLLSRTKEAGFFPDKRTYYEVVKMYFDLGDYETVQLLCKRIVTDGKTDILTYNLMLEACLKLGDLEAAESTWKDLKSHPEHQPNVGTYQLLLDLFQQQYQKEAELQLEDEIVTHDEPEKEIENHEEPEKETVDHEVPKKEVAGHKEARKPEEEATKENDTTQRARSKDKQTKAKDPQWSMRTDRTQTSRADSESTGTISPAQKKQLQKSREIERLLRALKKRGITDDIVAYNILLNKYSGLDQVEEAEKVWKDLRESSVKPTLVTYNTLISMFAKRKDFPSVEKILHELHEVGFKPDKVTFSIVLGLYQKLGRIDEAQGVWKQMINSGVKPDKIAYTLMLMMFKPPPPLALATLKPNLVSYTILIHLYAKLRAKEKAEELFWHVKNEGMTPDSTTYAVLIHMYLDLNFSEEAKWLWLEMREVNSVLGKGILQLGMQLFSRLGDKEMVETLKIELDESRRGKPDDSDARDRVDFIMSLWEDIKISNIDLDSRLCNEFLHVLSKYDMNATEFMWTELLQSQQHLLDAHSFTIMIDMYAHKENWQSAELLWEMMEQEGIRPNNITYNVFLDAYGKLGDIEKVRRLWSEMIENGVLPNELNYSTMLRTYTKLWREEDARALVEEMRDEKIPVLGKNFDDLIEMYGKLQKFEAAEACFEEMKFTGTPTIVSYNTMMAIYARNEDVEGVKRLWDELFDYAENKTVPRWEFNLD